MRCFILILLLVFSKVTFSITVIVDINGGGQFTVIQSAINAVGPNDTVKVWPGEYNQQVNLNKNIVLMGSGYENTVIISNYNPTITMSSGKLQWFKVSSLAGVGINVTGGVVTNCVIVGCSGDGILNNTNSTIATIVNCVLFNNSASGISAYNGGTLNVINCISRNNGNSGFYGYGGNLTLSYSNGYRNSTNGNQGCIDVDPSFTLPPVDFHISEGSQCWNTGNPSMTDPDGSRSDMGYFGGTDCPIYPTVFQIIVEPNGTNINLRAKARANY